MPPRGRPPLVRGVHSFERADWSPPEQIFIDTSVVVESLLVAQTHHSACAAMLRDLADAGTVLVFSQLLEPELCEAAYKVALKERWGNGWQRQRYDGRARRRASRRLEQVLSSWENLKTVMPYVCVDLDGGADRMVEFMKKGLGSYDALHASTAVTNGVPDMLTSDHGFARIPATELTLHVPAALLTSMRARRGGQAN